jgi:hypothetical protein
MLASFLWILMSCQKKDFNPIANEPVINGLNKKDVISTIDSLQQINFFIKDRPNPDMPLKGTNMQGTDIRLNNTGNEMEYTDETYMVLGLQLNNPYSIPNMTAAYNAFFNLQLGAVSVTHKYIRFSPTNESQIAMLDDSLELDLYTHPLDYEMLQDGDLYVPAGGSVEDIPFLYSVVPGNYQLPNNITYTILADLHLPEGDAALYIEELAESMALGANYSSNSFFQNESNITTIIREDVTFPNGEHPTWSHNFSDCLSPDYFTLCPDDPGYGPPNPQPPTPPSVCGLPGLSCIQSGYPRGRIRVLDTQLNQCVQVHDVQVRSKRWFKIRNTQTNTQGEFTINTRYNNNTQIRIIFRNGEVSVKPLRNNIGIRLSLFPVKSRLGTYSGCQLNTIDHIFYRTDGGVINEPLFALDVNDNWRFSKDFTNWLAATAIVARKNQLAQGNADGVGTMKSRSQGGHRIQLYLSTGGELSARGCVVSMPMLAYMNKGFTWNDVLDIGKFAWYAFKTFKSVSTGTVTPATVTNGITALQTLGKLVFQGSLPDGILMYNTLNRNLSSSEVHENFYEIFTNAGLLKNRVNKNDWKNYLKRTDNRATVISSGGTLFSLIMKPPFTTNDRWYNIVLGILAYTQASASFTSSIAALATQADGQLFEMYNGFSEAYAHTITDRRYGTLADDLYDQNFVEIKSTAVEGAHSIYIETWKSIEVVDVESTVPMSGLFYDLFDSRNDLVNAKPGQIDIPILSWNLIANTGLGITGSNTAPDRFTLWRNNITGIATTQSSAINNLFFYYGF